MSTISTKTKVSGSKKNGGWTVNDEALINTLVLMAHKWKKKDFAENNTVELLNHRIEKLDPDYDMFELKCNDEPFYRTIPSYVEKELKWYLSMNRSLIGSELEGNKFWFENVASKDGNARTNSNYGWYVFSPENGDMFNSQWDFCKKALIKDRNTRQAILVYMRPQMQYQWNLNGAHDFVCTFNQHFFIRDNKLIMIVNMRSNDCNTGFKNDFNWACYLYNKMLKELNDYLIEFDEDFEKPIKKGWIDWNADSFHCYPKDYPILEKVYDLYIKPIPFSAR